MNENNIFAEPSFSYAEHITEVPSPSNISMPNLSVSSSSPIYGCLIKNGNAVYYPVLCIIASESPISVTGGSGWAYLFDYTYNDKKVYFKADSCTTANAGNVDIPYTDIVSNVTGEIAWLMVYGGYGSSQHTDFVINITQTGDVYWDDLVSSSATSGTPLYGIGDPGDWSINPIGSKVQFKGEDIRRFGTSTNAVYSYEAPSRNATYLIK